MIDDAKYLQELREQLTIITEEKSFVDRDMYSALAHKIRNESPEGIKELIEMVAENDAECGESFVGSILALHNAFMLFEAVGCKNMSKRMLVVMSIISTLTESTEKYVDIALRAEKSKAKKGKTNRHHSEVLSIAGETWKKYPNASLAGVSEEIYTHLRSKWNDVPVSDTVKTWLKDSGLNPDVKPKNRNFKLVLTKGNGI
ncbi:hypothetical protein JT965_003854 [Salmonella enterica]|uniref:hypothetical protein n=1 Tax=Salmonella enterica TaxID=28901 RepID=UPI000BE2431B|nr:hypothetical protein [Salmonella enterica]EHA2523210.1 hypothetical protein [Salmonella enterica]EHC0365306.1 hypothetical protein [Salmonella enterica]PDN06162.1 hypothetical protein CCO46_18565 [Salmonella enterica subsp. enterica serovar Essen]HDV8379652.1 hypothetical protein [Citrobacter freundii]